MTDEPAEDVSTPDSDDEPSDVAPDTSLDRPHEDDHSPPVETEDSREGDTHVGSGKTESQAPETENPHRKSITEGSIATPLFHLAWPIVVFQLLQVTYNVVDTLYLGRLSAEAVGAVSLAFPLIFLLIAVASGFTVAGAILVAQYTGAEGDRSAGLVAGQTVTVVAGLSIVIAFVGYAITRPALELLPSDPDTSQDVIPLAADYLEIIFLGVPLMFGLFIFAALLRGYGDTKTPMYVVVVSVFLNILLDPFFIFGFRDNPLFYWLGLGGLEASLYAMTGFAGWGIEGAALATVVARGAATVIGLYLLFMTDVGPAVEFAHLWPDTEFIYDIFRLGTPSMIEDSTTALALIVLVGIVVTFDPPVVAAYGLGNRIISLVFLPAMGLGRAIDTMVGQNLGADRPDRAAKAVWLAAAVGSGMLFVVAVIVALAPEPIVSVFLGDVDRAGETISHGVDYIRIRSIEFVFIGLTTVLLGAFRGAGNTEIAMVISIISLWIGRVATVSLLVFVFGWGAMGIWVGMAFGQILGAAIALPWFLRGGWKEKYIDEDRIEATQA